MKLRSGKIVGAMDSERSEASQQEASSEEGQQVMEAPCLADILQQITIMMQQNAQQMGRNTQEIKQDMKRNVEEIRSEIKKSTDKVEKMCEEMKKLESDMTKKIEDQKRELKMDIRLYVEEVKADVEPIKARLKRLEERKSEKIQVTVHPSMLRGGDSDLKFYGDRRIHPIVYLKALSERLEDMGDRAEFKKIIRPTMKGSAELWYDMVEEKLDTIDDFTNAFIDYFWGEQAQSKVREDLYAGRFDETYGSSREEYAMRKMAVARYLEPQLSESDIVKYIARHFTDDIRDVVAIQGIAEVGKLLQYLRRVDDIKPVRRSRYVRTNPGETKDNGARYGERRNWEAPRNEQRPQQQKNRRESIQQGTGRLERERGEAMETRPRYGQQYQNEMRPRYNQAYQNQNQTYSNEARPRYAQYQERRGEERPRYQQRYQEPKENDRERQYGCNQIQTENEQESEKKETTENGHGRKEKVTVQIEPPPRRQDFQ